MSLRQQIKELRTKRAKLLADARKIIDKADAEKRAKTTEEQDQWERMNSEMDSMRDRIDQLERELAADDERDDDRDDDDKDDADKRDDDKDDDKDDKDDEGERQYITKGGRRYQLVKKQKRGQPGGGAGKATKLPYETAQEFATRQRRSSEEYRTVFWDYMARGDAALSTSAAKRAISADADIVGGYLVMPQEFQAKLIKFVDNLLFLRQKATKFTLKSAQSLGAPALDVDVSDADWTSELNTGNEDTSMQFGKRELVPHPLAKRLKVSNRLLRMASVSGGFSVDNSVAGGGAEGLVRDRLGYKFAVTEEKAFMTGNGVQQPLGMFTASARGISTGRDYLSGSATGITADALIGVKYNQKQQYWAKAEWLFHRNVMLLIRQLKDSQGRYIYMPGGQLYEGDSLLERPVNMSEYAPSTLTTGQYIGLFGDFSFYWIADAETLQVQRLVELYAAANQTGFIARQEIDGMPVLEEAFTRIKTN